MAEGTAPEVIDTDTAVAAVDMDVESGEPILKRAREEEDPQDDDVSKKQKLDDEKSVEEQRLEKLEEKEEEGQNKEEKEEEQNKEEKEVEQNKEEKEVEQNKEENEEEQNKEEKEEEQNKEEEKEGENKEEKEEEEKEKEASDPVKLGYKSFGSSSELFNYFYNFLHTWPQYLNINKYEHTMLLELLKKGHAEPDRKIGGGIRAFQIRKHPTFKSRCFFLIREDDSVDDFSFRKCVDHILPLPEEMHLKLDANKALGGGGGKQHHGGKGGRWKGGRGGGRGRGGRWRH